jgi:hypothetical protein
LLQFGKKQKYLAKVPPSEYTLLLVLRCLADGGRDCLIPTLWKDLVFRL